MMGKSIAITLAILPPMTAPVSTEDEVSIVGASAKKITDFQTIAKHNIHKIPKAGIITNYVCRVHKRIEASNHIRL